MELDGKSAIVTGAARGIGTACAEALAQKRARVVPSDVDRRAEEAEPLYAQAIAIREKILGME